MIPKLAVVTCLLVASTLSVAAEVEQVSSCVKFDMVNQRLTVKNVCGEAVRLLACAKATGDPSPCPQQTGAFSAFVVPTFGNVGSNDCNLARGTQSQISGIAHCYVPMDLQPGQAIAQHRISALAAMLAEHSYVICPYRNNTVIMTDINFSGGTFKGKCTTRQALSSLPSSRHGESTDSKQAKRSEPQKNESAAKQAPIFTEGGVDPNYAGFLNRLTESGCAIRETRKSYARPAFQRARQYIWKGACVDGYASGRGTLEHTENTQSNETVRVIKRGVMDRGGWHGVVNATIESNGVEDRSVIIKYFYSEGHWLSTE